MQSDDSNSENFDAGKTFDARDKIPDDEVRSAKSLGPYELIRELGRGGQGLVWLARDPRLNRMVALKLLPERALHSKLSRLRFEREAEVASKLDHPGICGVYEFGEFEGTPYIVMPWIDGETLDQKISGSSPAVAHSDTTFVEVEGEEDKAAHGGTDREPDEHRSTPSSTATIDPLQSRDEIASMAFIIEQAARALQVAHDAGLVHRDIKPGNIMINREGRPVLLDFGLARDDRFEGPTLTQTGDVLGTPAYMSPEQLDCEPSQLDLRTDVYSLGVTLYEGLAGRRPFEAQNRHDLYQQIRQGRCVDLRRWNPAVPKDLAIVVATAMEPERDRRYATALDLAEELRRVREFEPIKARPASSLLRLKRWTQRNPALATALAGLFLTLSTATAIFYLKSEELEDANRRLENRGTQLEIESAAKSRALFAKEEALTRERAAVLDFERLADARRLEQARREADELWPARPEQSAALQSWLDKHGRLQRVLDEHRASLFALQARALPYSQSDRRRDHAESFREIDRLKQTLSALSRDPDANTRKVQIAEIEAKIRSLRTRTEERRSWRFAGDDSAAWKRDRLEELVADLEAFTHPEGGVIASVRRRLDRSRDIEMETIGRQRDSWTKAAAAVRADRRFTGFELVPRVGLIPLGADPRTGLQEFLLWESHEGPMPRRDEASRWVIEGSTGMIFVLLPPGEAVIGAQNDAPGDPFYDENALDEEGPVHRVRLDAFLISKYEMTQGQWGRLASSNPSLFASGQQFGATTFDDSHPVERISHEQALMMLARWTLTLPTECQWEYAARSGSETPWCSGKEARVLGRWGNLSDGFAKRHGGPPDWTYDAANDDGRVLHAPVGSYLPNAFGLHDVIGNVYEWCLDARGAYLLATREGSGERLTTDSDRYVFRGGSFATPAKKARSSTRQHHVRDFADSSLGIRPVLRF